MAWPHGYLHGVTHENIAAALRAALVHSMHLKQITESYLHSRRDDKEKQNDTNTSK
jgi:hypothetical protein